MGMGDLCFDLQPELERLRGQFDSIMGDDPGEPDYAALIRETRKLLKNALKDIAYYEEFFVKEPERQRRTARS